MIKMNIDISRLSRDYEEKPLIPYREKPTKEDLEYLFLELNMTLPELGEYFKKSTSAVASYLKYYKIKKDRVRVSERSQQTQFERHGTNSPLADANIREGGMLRKYGARNPMKLERFKNAAVETNMKNRGVPYPTQSKEVLDLRNENNMKKYGYAHVSQRPNHYKRHKKRKEEQE